MTALAFVCLAALFINVTRDLFFAETRQIEVWLGVEVTGWAAILTAPVHWAIFAVGAWAFRRRRVWVVPWAAAYVFYVGLSHLVWSEASPDGRGWPVGVVQAAVLSLFGALLLRARHRLGHAATPQRAARDA